MKAQRGFTLLELLIAIGLFALLGIGTYRMLDTVLSSAAAVRAQEQALGELSRALWTLERDLQQAAPRPIRDGFGDERNALFGETQPEDGSQALEFSRSGWRNPTGMRRANLQRVRWRLNGDSLERLYWVVLDRAVDSQPRVQQMLDDVLALRLRYLDAQDSWREDWPPYEPGRGDPEAAAQRLPRAVEITLEHRRYGEIRRLLRLPDGPPSMLSFDQPDAQGRPPAAAEEPQP